MELPEPVNQNQVLVIEPTAALVLDRDLQEEGLEPCNVPVLIGWVE